MNNNSPRTPLANQDCSVRQESHNAAHYDIITGKSKDGASSPHRVHFHLEKVNLLTL